MSNTAPEDWMEWIQGITTILNDGVPVAGSPGATIANLINAATIAYNPTLVLASRGICVE